MEADLGNEDRHQVLSKHARFVETQALLAEGSGAAARAGGNPLRLSKADVLF